ncbi:MAG TPA: hypothetical protein QGG47_06560 [Acidobacteriota bacterium]|nr:hypothetical protein [Acidobacteriota bacterium]
MIASQTLRLGGTVALIALLALTATGAVDRRAQESSGAVFRRALITFAAARTLDGAISLAQGTEIALQPAGMGVTVSAGELLDPVNDLVEQFSSLMLIATTSLGLQNMLLRVSQWWVLGALLGLLTIARVALLWYPKVLDEPLRQLIAGAFVVALIVRFAVPLYALGSGLFFEHFLAPTQSEAVGAIEQASGDIRELERLGVESGPDADATWMERVSAWFAETVQRLDVRERIEAFRERLATVTEQLLHLVVVFTLQTIALPLAFLWLLPRVVSWTMRRLG